MELFLHQVLAGLATGAIYAAMALAVVMIYQAIDHLNFAQGEMAMFSTFIAWQLIQWGQPYWIAFVAAVGLSFLGGVAIERVLFRPLHNAPILSHIVRKDSNGQQLSTAVWICEYPYRTMRMEGPSSDCADCPVWFEIQRSRHAAVRQHDDIDWLEELSV